MSVFKDYKNMTDGQRLAVTCFGGATLGAAALTGGLGSLLLGVTAGTLVYHVCRKVLNNTFDLKNTAGQCKKSIDAQNMTSTAIAAALGLGAFISPVYGILVAGVCLVVCYNKRKRVLEYYEATVTNQGSK